MSDELKKFLENSKDYPDATPIKIGDVEVPLGSLRSLNATERQTLQERMKGVEATEKELTTKQATILDLANKAQAAYAAAEEARKAVGERKVEPGTDPFADPWLAPVKEAFSTRDKKLEEYAGQIKKLTDTLTTIAAIGADDRWDREYESIDFGKREKKPARDEILKYAMDNNIIDRHKMPSIRKAWEQMSAADREADKVKQAEERGRELGRQEALAARVPPPGVAGPGQMPPNAKTAAERSTLPDLYQESLKDSELRSLLEQISSAGLS
jgi:hypothetical protein